METSYIEVWEGLTIRLDATITRVDKDYVDGNFYIIIRRDHLLFSEKYDFGQDKDNRDAKYKEILSKLTLKNDGK